MSLCEKGFAGKKLNPIKPRNTWIQDNNSRLLWVRRANPVVSQVPIPNPDIRGAHPTQHLTHSTNKIFDECSMKNCKLSVAHFPIDIPDFLSSTSDKLRKGRRVVFDTSCSGNSQPVKVPPAIEISQFHTNNYHTASFSLLIHHIFPYQRARSVQAAFDGRNFFV